MNRKSIIGSIVCYSLIFLFCFNEVLGSEVFESFPLVKFDRQGLDPVIRKSSLHFTAASYHNSYDEALSRSKAIVLPYQEFIKRTEAFLNGDIPDISNNAIGDYQKTIAGGSSALIIVLPENMDSELSDKWRLAESTLLKNSFIIPVYFIYENDELDHIVRTIEAASGFEKITTQDKLYNAILGDDFQFTVSTSEPSVLKQVTGTNLKGWIGGNGDASSPTFAIVANYDALAASPELSFSSKTTTSSTVILLELARLFNKLYSQPRTQSQYNILFLLTTGGHFNYYGSKQWLNEIDDRLAKSLEFVICLDSLGEVSDSLYLHTSRPEKDPITKRLYNSFIEASKVLGMNLEVKQKKVNLSNTEEPWEHEQFSKRKLLASTLSSSAVSRENLGRSHIFDREDENIYETVKNNTQLLAEALVRHIFPGEYENLLVFQESLGVNEKLQKTWIDALTRTPRMMPHIPKDFVEELEEILKRYSTDVTKQEFTMNKKSEYIFYSQQKPTEMTVAIGKPFLFDVILAAIVGSYVAGVYQFIKMFNIFGV